MGTKDTRDKTIKSTQTAFDIIDIIASRDRPSTTEIATEVEYSRSTVHYHLKTLKQNRYVIQDDDGLRLGLRMARLGNLALEQHGLRGVIEKPADNLSTEANATAHVAVKEQNKLVWLYRSEDHELDEFVVDPGMETDIHCTAYGQAILAHIPSDTVDEIVGTYGLPAKTDQTLTTREEFDDRLSTIRKLGFAYSAEEHTTGVSSIAAPIIDDQTDEVVGAIGISDRDDQISNPYKHTKARRFSDALPGLVQQAAQIAGDKVTNM
ncbi:IclR family transcriptional regulator [Halomontanus rarus]|uniref:IclR family transcriptional regulator n=1 Tax=Halomontanus rarus TaxID=3034020 RepID=UPI0023E86B53|nr:IclR family transcriptional regulator [Halovivax sp. TS33]